MSAFPRVDTDVNENLNGPLSSFLQQNENSSSMSGMFDLSPPPPGGLEFSSL